MKNDKNLVDIKEDGEDEEEEEVEEEEEKQQCKEMGVKVNVVETAFQIGEMVQWILSFLDPVEDMPVARFVCRQWNATILNCLSHLLPSPLHPPSSSCSLGSSSSVGRTCKLTLEQNKCQQQQQQQLVLPKQPFRHVPWGLCRRNRQPKQRRQPGQTGQQAKQPLRCESSFDMGYFASCHAFRNHLNILRWARFDAGWHWDHRTCTEAARGGHFRVLAWAVANGCLWDKRNVCREALRSGSLSIVRWARAHGAHWSTHASINAVLGGRIAVLQWTRSHGCDWHEAAWAYIFSHHRQDMLRWARANGCMWRESSTQTTTIRSERMGVNRWAHAHGLPWRYICFNANAGAGCFDVVRWSCANGFPMGASLCAAAARTGQLDTLKWARERGCHWNAQVLFNAVLSRRVDVIKWAYANDCVWSSLMGELLVGQAESMDVIRWLCQNGASFTPLSCVLIAARRNAERRLALLRWVRFHGCVWNKSIYTEGAIAGHLALVQWASAHGCPSSVEACKSAVRDGQWRVLAWPASTDLCLFNNATDCHKQVEAMLCAAACGALDALAWMHRRLSHEALGLLYNPALQQREEDVSEHFRDALCDVAAANGHLAIIRWARERNHPWYESTCHAAAKGNHIGVLAWLRANGCPWNEAACRDIAYRMVCHGALAWITDNNLTTTRPTIRTTTRPTTTRTTTRPTTIRTT